MGADDNGKKKHLSWLRVTPATVVGTLSFLTVSILLLQERSYRRRLEHENEVDRGICEAQVPARECRLTPPVTYFSKTATFRAPSSRF